MKKIAHFIRSELSQGAGIWRTSSLMGIVQTRQCPVMPIGKRNRLRPFLDSLIALLHGTEEVPHDSVNPREGHREESTLTLRYLHESIRSQGSHRTGTQACRTFRAIRTQHQSLVLRPPRMTHLTQSLSSTRSLQP